jgi:hypothetical protein
VGYQSNSGNSAHSILLSVHAKREKGITIGPAASVSDCSQQAMWPPPAAVQPIRLDRETVIRLNAQLAAHLQPATIRQGDVLLVAVEILDPTQVALLRRNLLMALLPSPAPKPSTVSTTP